MGIGRKFIGKAIDKVGNKRQGLVIAFVMVAGISYASIDSIPYPITGNKQRLGFQTSGNGLVWRGTAADTVTKPTSYADKNIKAYLILDSVSGSLYVFKQGVWAAISGAGGFEQPIDSLFFDTSVPSNNVDTAKMRWDSERGTVVLGMYDQVSNELGFKNFWLVKNQTGSTITKGSIVYANGTVGASGRITIDKFIADGSIDAKYLLGITAHDLSNGEDGYVISFGKIRKVNTDTFAAGAILYPSPTVAGVWTDVEPVAPNIDMPIGFCINSHANNGTIAIRVASGYELSELHDVAITSPVENASLYYSGGLWRDTTAALLVSDTASMLSNYATKEYADTTGRLYARQDFTNVLTSTLTWTQTDTLIPGVVTVVQVYRNGQILLPSQYTIPTSTSVVIAATSFKVGDNYTVIFPRGGGAGSGSGSGSLTSISAGTGIVVSPNPITTTGTVSADLTVMMELTDTTLLNLTSRFASKLNTTDTASLSSRIDAKGNGTVTSVATGYGLNGGTITTTGTLLLDSAVVFSQIRDSIVDVAIGNDTIKILKQEYSPATTSVLTWTVTPKFPIQLKQYILVFRNGQLLINDQYNLTDTNQITIVSNSFKVGANYTVVTVSGIGSVGTGVFPNPVYPDAGIALSTGTTWASSIPNNSTNWNTAYTDRLKWDGNSTGLVAATGRTSLGGTTIGQSMFTLTNPSAITFPRFNSDNTITARTAANFRSDIGAGTVTNVNIASGTPMSITNNTTTPEISMAAATGSVNGYLTSTNWTTFNNKQNALSNASASVSGILTSTDWTTFNNKQNALTFTTPLVNTSNTITINQSSGSANGFLTSTDWTTFNNKQNALSNASASVSGILTSTDWTTFNNKQNALSNASASVSGILTSTDWTTFNGKQNALTFTTPLVNTSNTITINQSSGSANGFLTSTDWTTFNNKQNALSNASASVSGILTSTDWTTFNNKQNALSNASASVSGILTSTDWTTFNNKQNALSNASASVSGILTSTDWTTFNGKQNALTLTTTGTSGAATLVGSTLNIPQYTGGSGTVTNVSGTGAISVINPTTTPVISVATAAFGTAGIVSSSGTQQFSGDKVFEGISQFNGRAVFKNYTYVATRLAGLSSTDRFATVTIGSGLSLSSGTLSATGAGVTSVTASSPLSSSGGATPNITITDAGAAASGVVNTTTQSFAGNKTFNSDIIVNGVNIGKGASSISSNTRVGVGALSSITTGIHNTSIGNGAGDLITTGESNTFLGSDAGFNITTGSYNTVIGHNSYPSANNGTLQLIIGHNLLGKGNYTAFIGGSGGAYNEKNVTTWETTSDIRLKKNIKTYNEGLNKINQIDVKNFEYRSKDEIIDSLKLSVIERSGIQIGVIAQEYKEIFPESVSVNSTGILSINTDNLIWHLVNSIKELSAELKILKIEIENLKK
jgi:hypothetical protein